MENQGRMKKPGKIKEPPYDPAKTPPVKPPNRLPDEPPIEDPPPEPEPHTPPDQNPPFGDPPKKNGSKIFIAWFTDTPNRSAS
jgi:hypothetical protein